MIEFKKKPEEPCRKFLECIVMYLFPEHTNEGDDVDYEDYEDLPNPTLADMVKFFESKGIPLDMVVSTYGNVTSGANLTYYSHPCFYFDKYEPLEQYNKKVEQYEKDLKEYKQWYSENKEKIKASKVLLKEQEKEHKELDKLARKKRQLVKQQEKIKLELEKLSNKE